MLKRIDKIKKAINYFKAHPKEEVTANIILELCNEEVTRANQMELALILKELGYKRKHTRIGKRWYLDT